MKWYLMRMYANWLCPVNENLTNGLADDWLSPRFPFLGQWELENAQWWEVENSCDLEGLLIGSYKVANTKSRMVVELLMEDS